MRSSGGLRFDPATTCSRCGDAEKDHEFNLSVLRDECRAPHAYRCPCIGFYSLADAWEDVPAPVIGVPRYHWDDYRRYPTGPVIHKDRTVNMRPIMQYVADVKASVADRLYRAQWDYFAAFPESVPPKPLPAASPAPKDAVRL